MLLFTIDRSIPTSADVESEVQYYKHLNIPYQTLSDGQVIIVGGNKTENCES
jgi:hypothetical protein